METTQIGLLESIYPIVSLARVGAIRGPHNETYHNSKAVDSPVGKLKARHRFLHSCISIPLDGRARLEKSKSDRSFISCGCRCENAKEQVKLIAQTADSSLLQIWSHQEDTTLIRISPA